MQLAITVKQLFTHIKVTGLLVTALAIGAAMPLQATADKTLTVINQRDAFPIWQVYITPAGQSGWGDDQLGGQTIPVGSSYTWRVTWDGCYVDVKAKTFTGLSIENLNINVCGGFNWTVYDEPAQKQVKTLKIINNRDAFPIWKVYITSAGESGWGQDQLGGQTIAAGYSYTWNIPWNGCYVDVRAETFTGLSTERRNINICGGMEWTLYDN